MTTLTRIDTTEIERAAVALTHERKRLYGRTFETAYPYRDQSGAVLFWKIRYSPKTFAPLRHDGQGYVDNLDGVPKIPYNLPEVLATVASGGIVFKGEGEKDADNLNRALSAAGINAIATTGNEGAKGWQAEHSKHLAGASVVIIPDNDKAGRDGAIIAARSLRAAGVSSLKVVELPYDFNGQPVKDVSDYLAAGGTVAELMAMVASAPEYYPPAEQSTVRFPRTVERRQFAPDDNAHQWAQNELDRYAGEMARQTDGRRVGKRSANSTALILGGIAAHRLLTESECYSALLSAAEQNGSIAKYKISWFDAEFHSGFTDGLANPCALPDYVKYADDRRYALPTVPRSAILISGGNVPHAMPVTPCDTTCHTEVDDLPSLADELASIGIERDPQYLLTWGKAYQTAIRDMFGNRARAINRLLTAAVAHADYGVGEPFTPAELVRASEGLSFHVIERAMDTLKVFTAALLGIDECIYIPQNGSKSRGRKSQHRLTVFPKNQIDAALIRLYRQHLYIKLCKLARLEPLAIFQDMLEGLPDLPTGDDLSALYADVSRDLETNLDPAIAHKHRTIMRDVESKLKRFRDTLATAGQVQAEQDTRAVVAAAIGKATDAATRRSLSGAISLTEVAEQAGVSVDTVTRHRRDLGWKLVPVIKWSEPVKDASDLPKPFIGSKRYRGAFITVRIERPDGSVYGDASAGKKNLRPFIQSMLADGYTVRLGYRTASIWKQAEDVTAEDNALITKYNRRPEPPSYSSNALNLPDMPAGEALTDDTPKTPALPRLMRDKMRARDNTLPYSPALQTATDPLVGLLVAEHGGRVASSFKTDNLSEMNVATPCKPSDPMQAISVGMIEVVETATTSPTVTPDQTVDDLDDPLLALLIPDHGRGRITISEHPGKALLDAYNALPVGRPRYDYHDGLTDNQRRDLILYKTRHLSEVA